MGHHIKILAKLYKLSTDKSRLIYILNYKRNPSVTFKGNYGKIIKKSKYIYTIFFNNHLCIKLLNNATVLLKPVYTVCQCIGKGSFPKMTSFRQLVVYSSSSLNQFTSSNNGYVPLWKGNQVWFEAKTNCVSLVSPDLNTIQQLLDELWRRIQDRSVQPRNLGQLHVVLH